jgi:hypothetical protein
MVNTSPKIIELNVQINKNLEKLETNENIIRHLKKILETAFHSDDIGEKEHALAEYNSYIKKIIFHD